MAEQPVAVLGDQREEAGSTAVGTLAGRGAIRRIVMF
jgi:hypothetical protein